jgi:hypothetical protein
MNLTTAWPFVCFQLNPTVHYFPQKSDQFIIKKEKKYKISDAVITAVKRMKIEFCTRHYLWKLRKVIFFLFILNFWKFVRQMRKFWNGYNCFSMVSIKKKKIWYKMFLESRFESTKPLLGILSRILEGLFELWGSFKKKRRCRTRVLHQNVA